METDDARAARDAGIQQAADHAEEVHQDWGELAFEALRLFAAGKRGSGQAFTSEDVRKSIAGLHVPAPPHLRAWGSVFQRAARERLIEKVGVTHSAAAHCHLSYVAQWKAV
jgi:transposase InsO family protein